MLNPFDPIGEPVFIVTIENPPGPDGMPGSYVMWRVKFIQLPDLNERIPLGGTCHIEYVWENPHNV